MDTKQNHRLSPKYVLLGFLYHGPGHGYELHKRLMDEFGFIWHVSQSQTYNILKRLEDQGYISSTTVEQEKLPPRQLLHLTPVGEKHFISWLETPTGCSVHAIRVEFITRLFFIQQFYPHKIIQTIQDQSQEVQKGITQLKETCTHLPEDQVFNRLALDLRIKLLRSILTWLDECGVAITTY